MPRTKEQDAVYQAEYRMRPGVMEQRREAASRYHRSTKGETARRTYQARPAVRERRRWDTRLRRLRERGVEITQEQYAVMYAAQGGACGICRAVRRVLCVDHDHQTGAIRGLLCFGCNSAIGRLGDSPEALRRALQYLERLP